MQCSIFSPVNSKDNIYLSIKNKKIKTRFKKKIKLKERNKKLRKQIQEKNFPTRGGGGPKKKKQKRDRQTDIQTLHHNIYIIITIIDLIIKIVKEVKLFF